MGTFARGMGEVVLSRLRLLAHLRAAGLPLVAALCGGLAFTYLLPALSALAAGLLVARVAEQFGISGANLAAVTGPLVLVAGLLVAEQLMGQLNAPLQTAVQRRVDGGVRSRVRSAVLAPRGIAHLEDQSVRNDVHAAVAGTGQGSIGAGAAGQLVLIARFVGGVASGAVLARFSVVLAIALLVAIVWTRGWLRRKWMRLIDLHMGQMPAFRKTAYVSQFATSPAAAKEVRVFGLSDWLTDRHEQCYRDGYAPVWAARRKLMLEQKSTFVIAVLTYGVPLLALGLAGLGGAVSIGELAAYLRATFAMFALSAVGFEVLAVEHGLPAVAALERVERLAERPEEWRPVPEAWEVVRFESVSFVYPGSSVPVFEDLSIEIRRGSALAIVGENGAGKTTLIKLLAGLYEPTSGRITVDGVDLRLLDVAGWRRELAVIFQDFVHYELSARDNVSLSAASNPDLFGAAEDAGILDIIEGLPQAWDTMLSRSYADGAELSGGQWQRLALARALYASRTGAQILVLDEPTANLDIRAEFELFAGLLDHARDRTMILISHRFSTVRRAERIVVLDKGTIVEDGSHEELLAAEGRYARMFRLQAERFTERGSAEAPA